MRTNTKAVVTGDRLGVHWGTGTFWELAVIIYVQHLQICFESGGTGREKAGFSLPYKVYGAESAFLILISDLLNLSDLLPDLSPAYKVQSHLCTLMSDLRVIQNIDPSCLGCKALGRYMTSSFIIHTPLEL